MAWTKQNIFPARDVAGDGSACVMKLLDKEFLRDAVKARGGVDRTSLSLYLPHAIQQTEMDIHSVWETSGYLVDGDYTPSVQWDVGSPMFPWTKEEKRGKDFVRVGRSSAVVEGVRRMFRDIREMRRVKWYSNVTDSLTFTDEEYGTRMDKQVYGYFFDKASGDTGRLTASGGNLLLTSNPPVNTKTQCVAFVSLAIVATDFGQLNYAIPFDVSNFTVSAASLMAGARAGLSHYGISERSSGKSQSIVVYYGNVNCLAYIGDATDISDIGWNWEPSA